MAGPAVARLAFPAGTRVIGAATTRVPPARRSGAAMTVCRRSSLAARLATLAVSRASSAATAARSAGDRARFAGAVCGAVAMAQHPARQGEVIAVSAFTCARPPQACGVQPVTSATRRRQVASQAGLASAPRASATRISSARR